MPITKLTLRNFQRHEKLTIRFSPTITTIVGANGSGKTAILRAIRLIATNQPSGLGMVRRGKKEKENDKGKDSNNRRLKVIAEIEGHTVSRIRGKRTNLYRLDGKRLAAFGRSKVPDEVDKLLNIGDVNFARQMDSPFWFSDSAGQVSKKLNQIINLDSIDKALEFIAKKTRKANAEVEVSKDRLKALKIEVAKAKWVRECGMDLADLELAKKRSSEIEIKRNRLEILVETAKRSRQREIDAVRASEEAEEVVRLGTLSEKSHTDRKTLAEMVQKAKKYKRLVKKTTTEFLADFDSLLEVNGNMFKAAEDRRSLDYLVAELAEANLNKQSTENELRKAERLLEKKKGKKCPTCGQKIR